MKKQGKIYGRPRDQPLPDLSLGQLLLDKIRARSDPVFLIDGDNGNQLTNNDLLEKSVKVAKFLQRHGIKIEDRICIACENRLDWVIPAYATIYIGAICAPYNPLYTEWEFRNMLNVSKPRIVFVSRRTEEVFVKIQPSLAWQMDIIQLDNEPLTANMRTLTSILNNEEIVNFPEYNAVDIGDTSKHAAVILNSSGTTGLPKGVTLSHKNLIAFITEASKRDFLDVNRDIRYIIFLPFYHGYAFGLLMLCLINNASVVVMSSFNPELFMKLIEKYKPTYLPIVPPIMTLLAKSPLVEKYDFRSVTEILCAAAPLSKKFIASVKARIGVKHIRNAYGMTELAIMSHISDREADDIGGMYHLVPGLYSKVVDIETLETVDAGSVGEICFKGEQVMLGYWENPEATKQTIDKDGWLHSGDLGYYDERGMLYVVDRLKELIKYKGYQVSPSEIEMVLLSQPAVKEAAVCGRSDPSSGELPAAMIVKQSGATVTAEDIMEFVKQKLSPQKWLRGGVYFIDAIPRNSTGKVLRREVRSMIEATISKL